MDPKVNGESLRRNTIFAFESTSSKICINYKGGNLNYRMKKPGRHHFYKLIKVNITHTWWHCMLPNKIYWKETIASVLFLPQTHNLNLIIRKHQTKPNVLQCNWPILFRSVNFITCHRSEETIETWQLHAGWDPEESPGKEKDMEK